MGWLIGGFVLMTFVGIGYVGCKTEEAHDAFMADCLADGKKAYQCQALWGQANPHSPQPIVIPLH